MAIKSSDEIVFPKLMSVGQAALILSVHPNTLRNWSNKGLIPSYRIGQRRDRRFALNDLQEFLERIETVGA